MSDTPHTDALLAEFNEEYIESHPPFANWLRRLSDHARKLERENATLLGAAQESLQLLQTGAPGWGVAKDLLRAAIIKALGK